MNGETPSPAQIKRARARANLSQKAAAALIYQERKSWNRYEAGLVAMHPALWELWNIKAKRAQPNREVA